MGKITAVPQKNRRTAPHSSDAMFSGGNCRAVQTLAAGKRSCLNDTTRFFTILLVQKQTGFLLKTVLSLFSTS
jgi:hypothetical protein